MKNIVTIITIWYNEEKNLPKLYKSLQKIESVLPHQKIYIDQSSDDDSVKLAKYYGCTTHIHPNQWYADPDKKWTVEELCSDDDWILILDADEEITPQLAQEIYTVIQSEHEVWKILVRSIILWWFWWEAYQPRLFKKRAVEITDEIHNYIHTKSHKIIKLKHPIINDDLKYKWKEIQVFIEKLNRYSDKEIMELTHLNQYRIIRYMIWKPLQRFFGFWIVHKQFLRWIKWLILCTLMAYYQWLIYIKLYEKKYIV